MNTINDTDRLNWLIEINDRGDFGSRQRANVLSFSDMSGWAAYRVGCAPSTEVRIFQTAREAIDDAILNPRPMV